MRKLKMLGVSGVVGFLGSQANAAVDVTGEIAGGLTSLEGLVTPILTFSVGMVVAAIAIKYFRKG